MPVADTVEVYFPLITRAMAGYVVLLHRTQALGKN